MKKITYQEAINDITDYINVSNFDVEYLQTIYSYLLNKVILIEEEADA